jgi:hypothetical protein
MNYDIMTMIISLKIMMGREKKVLLEPVYNKCK